MDVFLRSTGYGGFRVRVRAGDTLEVWGLPGAGAPSFEVDAALILDLLATQFRLARLVSAMVAAPGDPLGPERMILRLEDPPPAVRPAPLPLPIPRKPLATARQKHEDRQRAKLERKGGGAMRKKLGGLVLVLALAGCAPSVSQQIYESCLRETARNPEWASSRFYGARASDPATWPQACARYVEGNAIAAGRRVGAGTGGGTVCTSLIPGVLTCSGGQ